MDSIRSTSITVLTKLLKSGRRAVEPLLDFCFPPECQLCGATEGLNVPRCHVFCAECVRRMSPAPVNRCPRCAAELGPFASPDGCHHCRGRALRFESVTCLGMYENELKQAVLGAKWALSSVRITTLGELLWSAREPDLRALNADRILPIPQHWTQRLRRHFNPAWLLGQTLARRLRVRCDPHVLKRCRRCSPQKRVAVSRRFENQRNSFTVQDPHVVRDETILLVDDVLTTGATCSEAARLLKAAGAKAVHVAALARVLDHSA